jgi:hypothetical protein
VGVISRLFGKPRSVPNEGWAGISALKAHYYVVDPMPDMRWADVKALCV